MPPVVQLFTDKPFSAYARVVRHLPPLPNPSKANTDRDSPTHDLFTVSTIDTNQHSEHESIEMRRLRPTHHEIQPIDCPGDPQRRKRSKGGQPLSKGSKSARKTTKHKRSKSEWEMNDLSIDERGDTSKRVYPPPSRD